MVYDCKPTLKRKARLVANGNLTDTPVDSIYSSVVSIKGLKMTIFIAELNGMDTWTTDVGNAYLEAYTDESNKKVTFHQVRLNIKYLLN